MPENAVASSPFINVITLNVRAKDFEIAVLREWGNIPRISAPKETPFTREELALLMRSPFKPDESED